MSDLLKGLQDFMDEKDIVQLEADDVSVMTKEKANYFLKKYKELEDEKSELDKTTKTEIERITKNVNEFKEAEIKKLDAAQDYLASILKSFAAEELVGKKAKSVKLPYGSVGFRAQQPSVDYIDQSAAEEFLKKSYKDLINVKVTESIKKADLKKAATVKDNKYYIDDIEVPGITVTEREDTFVVK